MSLYSSGIQLLLRPPRSIFSIGNDDIRATLPDFDSVAELSRFTRRLFDWHITIPHFYHQVIAGACLSCLIVIVVGLVMARKVYQGKFWLLRVVRKPSGVIVLPNPVLAFLLLTGLYGVIFTPFFVLACKQFTQHTGQPPRHILLWMTLPLLLLAYALILAVLGTFFSTPNALLSPAKEEQNMCPSLKRFFQRADVINSIALLGPLAITAAITIPAVIASVQWEKASAMQRNWQLQYSLMPNFTEAMVQQSQQIWYQALGAAKIGSIVFALWTMFALVLSTAYCYVAFNLITAVRGDIERVKEAEKSSQHTVMEEGAATVSQIIRDTLHAIKLRTTSDQARFLPATSGGAFSARPSFSTQRMKDNAQCEEAQKEQIVDDAATGSNESKALRGALLQIFFQAIAIGPGSACFGGLTLALSLTLHSKLEQPNERGGNEFERCIGPIWMALMCVSCFLGALSIFAVGYVTYEPVLHRHVAASQIRFKDITKGSGHIRATFFDVKTTSLCSSPVKGEQQLDSRKEEVKEVSLEGLQLPEMRGSSGDLIWMQSLDVEAEPLGYSANSTRVGLMYS